MEKNNEVRFSRISHDLRTPITGIQMMLHLLLEQKAGPLNERQLTMVNQAISDCERLLNLVQIHLEKDA